MKKILVIQIALLILLPSSFYCIVSLTDTYEKVKITIVSVLCLSCIKMKPYFTIKFLFATKLPSFVMENLSKGILFFHFRIDSCKSCDKLDKELSSVFDCNLEGVNYLVVKREFYGINVTFIHINLDHVGEDKRQLYSLFNTMGEKGGVPMISIVTMGLKEGKANPCYATLYGYQSKEKILRFIKKGVETYMRSNP